MSNRNHRARKWPNAFQDMVEHNLSNSISLVARNLESPEVFQTHFESLMCQVQWGYQYCPEVSAKLLLSMHPWPARWALIDSWCYQLELAIDIPDIPFSEKKQLKACLTDVYLVAGLSQKVIDISKDLFIPGSEDQCEYAKLVVFSGGAWISALISQGKLSQAEDILHEMEQHLSSPNQNQQIQMARAILSLQKAILLRHENKLPEALDTLTYVIKSLAPVSPLTRSIFFEVVETRAVFYRASGNYDAALADLYELQNNYISDGEQLAQSSLHGNRGLVYWSMANYKDAERELLSAIEITEKHKAYPLLSRQLGPLSLIYLAKGDIEKAIRFVERQIEITNVTNNLSEKTLASANRSCMLIYAHRAEEALPDLLFSLNEMLVQGRQELTISAHLDLAICYYTLGDMQNSQYHALQAYESSIQGENKINKMLAMRALALSQNAQEATSLLYEALEIAKDNGKLLDEAACLLCLSQIEPIIDLKENYWNEAACLLERIGAEKWLDRKNIGQPTILPFLL